MDVRRSNLSNLSEYSEIPDGGHSEGYGGSPGGGYDGGFQGGNNNINHYQETAPDVARAKRDAFRNVKKKKSEKSMDFDDLLPHVGEFGKYQKLLVFFICLPACIPCGFHAFNQLFMSPVPPHWCSVPELEETSLNWETVKNLSIPRDENGAFSKCSMYATDYHIVKLMNITTPDVNWPIVGCKHGWTFDTYPIFSSIVIDFNLVCDKAIYPTVGLSVLNIGGIIGVYMFGTISDKFGRRISFLVCLAVEQVFGLITAFAPNFWAWTACRFMVGLTIPAIYQIPFIISLELVGPSYRSFVTVMTCLFYVGGMMLLVVVAYFVRDWVYLCLVTSLPFFSYIIYWWLLPESPRWLLSQGRLQEAKKILERMASVNGTELPESFINSLKQRMLAQQVISQQNTAQENVGFMSLWETPNVRLKSFLITLTWIANETVYVGLSYYGPAMGDDEYISFFLSCVVEVPSYLLCWIVMDRWGRRWILGVGMIVGGIFSVGTVLMPAGAANATLILYLVAKFSESAAFLIIYPFAAELYPTEIRGIGIGFSAYMGGIGLVVIPFINYLGTEMLVLPLIIMGIMSVIGGIAAFRLPETLKQKLPNTIEEGEEFGKDFTWGDCWTCVPNNAKTTEDEDNGDQYLQDEIIEIQNIQSRKASITSQKLNKVLGENTPLNCGASTSVTKRQILRQQSVIDTPIVTDASGAMKLTFWV